MPCRWMSRARAARAAACANHDLPQPSSSPDVEPWKAIRRRNLRQMRKQIRTVILFMALIEAIRVGPAQIVYAGKHGFPAPGEEDFGIAYTMGYFFSWLYMCLFMIIYVPFFQWWVDKLFPATPEDSTKPSLGMKAVCLLKKINMILLPMTIGISLATWAYYLFHTFVYVDSRTFGSRKLPKNTRKNWAVRIFMLVGIAISTSLGYGAFQVLAEYELAHVKTLEYAIIVVPMQINLGIVLGSIMQFRMERRCARKQALMLQDAKVEEATTDEKAALVEV